MVTTTNAEELAEDHLSIRQLSGHTVEVERPDGAGSLVLEMGRVYLYMGYDKRYQGHEYVLESFVLDVPSYQTKVVTLGLTGPDKGVRHCCTLANFSTRFTPAGYKRTT